MAIPVKAQLIVFFRIGAGGLNTTLQPLSLNNVQVITAKQVSRVTVYHYVKHITKGHSKVSL